MDVLHRGAGPTEPQLSAQHNSPTAFACNVHGARHDVFIASGCGTDASSAKEIERLLISTASRRFSRQPLTFLTPECVSIHESQPNAWIDALSRCQCIVILLSLEAITIMKEKAVIGTDDKFLHLIKTVTDLKSENKELSLILLTVDCVNFDISQPAHTELKLQPLLDATNPLHDQLGAVFHALGQVERLRYRRDRPHRAIYFISKIFGCINPDPETSRSLYLEHCSDCSLRVEISNLDELLKRITRTGRAIVSGNSGMGKTVLVRQFLHLLMGTLLTHNRSELYDFKQSTGCTSPQYSRLFWIRCATEWTALDSLVAIFPKVDPKTVKEYASRFFAENKSYLLILDDVNDMSVLDSLFQGAAVAGFGGDVVATTERTAESDDSFLTDLGNKLSDTRQTIIPLQPWSLWASLQYVFNLTYLAEIMYKTQGWRPPAMRIVEYINGHPLAAQVLPLVWNYHGFSIEELEADFAKTLAEHDPQDPIPSSLKTIVNMSMAAFMKKGDEGVAACRLFGALCLVGPDAIPSLLTEEIIKTVDISSDGSSLIQVISSNGLLKLTMSNHCFIHDAIGALVWRFIDEHPEIDGEAIRGATGRALLSLSNAAIALGNETKDPSASCPYDPPHVSPLVDYRGTVWSKQLDFFAESDHGDAYGQVLHYQIELSAAQLAQARMQFSKAIYFYQASLKRALRTHGTKEHIDIATIYHSLGDIARFEGRIASAQEYYIEACAIAERVHQTRRDPSIALMLHRLGAIAASQDRLDDALPLLQESLDLTTELLGTRRDQSVAHLLAHIGNINFSQGQYSDAFRHLREARDIAVEFDPVGRTAEVREIVKMLASAADRLDWVDEACKHHLELLNMFTIIHHTYDHPDCADTLEDVSRTFDRKGDLHQAIDKLEMALRVRLKIHVGTDDPAVVKTQRKLDELKKRERDAKFAQQRDLYYRVYSDAVKACDAGNHGAAVVNFGFSLEQCQNAHGSAKHLDAGQMSYMMALAMLDLGQSEKSLTHFQDAIDTLEEVCGTRERQDIAIIYGFMGTAAASLSLRKDVMRYFSEALEMFIRSPPGSDCFFSSSALIKSGDLYGSVIRTVSPDPSPDAVDVGMHIHPKKEPLSVASSLAGMASVAALKGKFQIAYDLSKQVLSILITAQAPALLIARAHHNMGIVLRCLDHRGDAWEQLQQARDIYVGLHGTSDHRDIAQVLHEFGWLFHVAGDFDRALSSHQEALAIIDRTMASQAGEDAADFLRGCGESSLKLGHLDEAAAYLNESHETFTGLSDLKLSLGGSYTLCALGDLKRTQGQIDDATRLYANSMAQAQGLIESRTHPLIARCLSGLAEIDISSLRYRKAQGHLEEAVSILCASVPNHPDTESAKSQLEEIQVELGRSETVSSLDGGADEAGGSKADNEPPHVHVVGSNKSLQTDQESAEGGL
ncbi:uncharacterized protein BJ171DRAFT_478793 [Polychytrium aggregatum]|uniref:uncharacterized protein n=1 Tax=Polychytrium aggregatum TaxID=110093 RepID=UPI0022FF111F|nr:uncharacterized protein BJ171DRAFT_478793 [Polychytrium aggregatum]KAI9193538.1 hypothetical protein BJ171DRAFT_478793 [Polychytrium aggregatum]